MVRLVSASRDGCVCGVGKRQTNSISESITAYFSGLDQLVDSILLQADLLEVSSDNEANVEAVVLESRQVFGVGPATSLIVRQGTLTKGQVI